MCIYSIYSKYDNKIILTTFVEKFRSFTCSALAMSFGPLSSHACGVFVS